MKLIICLLGLGLLLNVQTTFADESANIPDSSKSVPQGAPAIVPIAKCCTKNIPDTPVCKKFDGNICVDDVTKEQAAAAAAAKPSTAVIPAE